MKNIEAPEVSSHYSSSLAVSVKHLSPEDIPEVIQVHQQAFQGYLNTQLGDLYLKTFFEWFISAKNAISLGAFDQKEHIIGYVVGAPLGYRLDLEKKLIFPAILGALLNFWIIFSPRFRKIVLDRLGFYNSKRQLGGQLSSPIDEIPSPTISLVGISVLPSARGNKVGEILMMSFEEQALLQNIKAMRLSVYPDNVAARKLYERMNWKVYYQLSDPDSAMYYYKVLASENNDK